jgi:hypothetical protein
MPLKVPCIAGSEDFFEIAHAVRSQIQSPEQRLLISKSYNALLGPVLTAPTGIVPSVGIPDIPEFIRVNYDVHESNHASAVLMTDFPNEWKDIVEILTAFKLRRSQILRPGGAKSDITKGLDDGFFARGWKEMSVTTKMVVDDEHKEMRTHKIDCFKNRVGLELEWNSKDQTFIRDLNNFRILFELDRLSVGIIVSRAEELQGIFASLGKEIANKYGASTTHLGKLLPRLRAGAADGCPVLVLGIKKSLYVKD